MYPRVIHQSKGFTLIELLVVIAIIGLLSSVILASLNTARTKGNDAATQEDMHNMRAQAELSSSSNGNSYANVCTDVNIIKQLTAAATTAGQVWTSTASNGANATCTNSAGAWMAYVLLKGSGKWWCVDNTGTAKNENSSPGAAATVCP